jgi:hypothetical protein
VELDDDAGRAGAAVGATIIGAEVAWSSADPKAAHAKAGAGTESTLVSMPDPSGAGTESTLVSMPDPVPKYLWISCRAQVQEFGSSVAARYKTATLNVELY